MPGEKRALFREDALSYRSTLILRFLMIAGVLVFHAGQYFHFQFPDCGHLCVAAFFFMSGYGLELSRSTKRFYMRDFLQKRVLGLMIQYWLILMVIAAVVMAMQPEVDLLYMNISNAFLRNPWWYITELMVFYIIYYLGTMMSSKVMRYLWIIAADCVMMLMMTEYFGMDVYLKSGLCFIFGMLWYEFRDKASILVRKMFPVILVVAAALMIPAYRNPNDLYDMLMCGMTCICMVLVYICLATLEVRRAFPVHLLFAVVGLYLTFELMSRGERSEGAFMLFMMSLSAMLVQFETASKPLVFLGAASLEMYLMQFMFFQVPDLDATLPDWAATLLAFALMVAVSLPTWKLCQIVMGRYNEGLKRFDSGDPA